MAFSNSLTPWYWSKRNTPIRREDTEPSDFDLLQAEINRRFNTLFSVLQPTSSLLENGFEPRLDLTETEKELKVTIELPGMDEKDIDVSLSQNTLTIKGEKKQGKEDRIHGYYRVERNYGSFQRTVALPMEVNSNKVEANFKKGLLTITLLKAEKEQAKGKKIAIQTN